MVAYIYMLNTNKQGLIARGGWPKPVSDYCRPPFLSWWAPHARAILNPRT